MNDIWVVDAGGGEPTALITDPESEFTPFWLLDGSRLVFAVFDFRTAAGPYHGRLISVLPDGRGRKDLAPVAERNAVLSRDGRYVAWGGVDAGITLLDRSTGAARQLTTDGGTDPIWSPDGKALLVREPYLDAVAVVEVPSGHVTSFRKPNIEAVVGWTADGGSIVFSTDSPDGNFPHWIAPAAGGQVVMMPSHTALADPETWSAPDGRWTVDGALLAWAAGGEPVELAPDLRMLTEPPSWSTDVSAFAFTGSTLDEVGDRKSSIYVASLDGRTPARITAGPYDSSPAWEPTP